MLQRLVELVIARSNERTLLAQGAYEVGSKHYPYMILLHSSFFVCLFFEVYFQHMPVQINWLLFALFFVLQGARVWCLWALGEFWNTKIIVLPGAEFVTRGPYKFMNHPNYAIVCLEIFLLPAMFQAYGTAILFTILNASMLRVRIPVEEKALEEARDNEGDKVKMAN